SCAYYGSRRLPSLSLFPLRGHSCEPTLCRAEETDHPEVNVFSSLFLLVRLFPYTPSPPSPPCELRDLVCLDELAIGCPECSLSVTLFKKATILLVQFDSSCIVKDSTTSSIFAFSLLRQTMFPMPGLFLLWWFGFSREPIDLGRPPPTPPSPEV
ncbi:hypothetical protein JMJ77_0012829, partial [Colletotrichum scovillei]